jgi:signal transduction histidine kinase
MMTTSHARINAKKEISIDSIELIEGKGMLVVCNDEYTASKVLRRNPRAQVIRSQEDDRIALVYSLEDAVLMNAVKKA